MFHAIRRARHRLLALLGVALAAGGAVAGVLCWTLAAGLPPLDGALAVEGIGEGVTVERDGAGIPTLTGSSRVDLAFALGVCHAQDRLFQMDLMRRHTAGELAEVVGAAAAGEDARMRVHRFRARAKGLLAAAEPWERELIAAYTRGVEAGRATLQRLPWEYLALQARWEPWREEDCLLVALGMYETLQHGPAEQERALGTVYDTLPPALADFLAPAGSRWDAALDGSVFSPARLPTPAEVDLRKKLLHAPRLDPGDVDEPAKNGSNNWAVSRRRTKDGRAIIACDMHLGLMVPGIWYRARLRHGDADITGVTLPGAPAVVVGSNGHIAWGFTNAEADTSDLVVVEEAEGGYRTPGGVRPFERHDEVIRVKGGADRTVSVEETIWGPVIGTDHRGRKLALRWVAHDAGSVNLRLMKLEACRGVPEALLIAPTCGVPAQNFMVADDAGRIGWTILGRLPRRFGHAGRVPSSWADGKRGWAGFLPGGEHPRVFDPPDGVLWTANNRTVGGECATCVGFGSADPGARAGQIRDGLRSRPRVTEADMLAVQLDDRALFLTRWQGLLLETLADGPADVRMMVRGWGGRRRGRWGSGW